MGINADTGNAAAFADDRVQLLDQVIDRVISIHAADTETKGELRHVLLGTGVADGNVVTVRLDSEQEGACYDQGYGRPFG